MIHQPKNSKYNIVSDHFPILGIFKLLRSEMIWNYDSYHFIFQIF